MAPSSTPSAPPAERREPRIFETWEGNDVRTPSLHARSFRSIPERSRSRARLPRRVPTAGTTPSDLPPPSPHIFGSAAIFLRRAVHDRAVAGRSPWHVRARPDPVHRVQRTRRPRRRVEVLPRVHDRRRRVATLVPRKPRRRGNHRSGHRPKGTVQAPDGRPRARGTAKKSFQTAEASRSSGTTRATYTNHRGRTTAASTTTASTNSTTTARGSEPR